MEKKYTHGPWFQSHRVCDSEGNYSTQVYCSKGETIATLSWYPKPAERILHNGKLVTMTGTYREGNARLIAAAPELLEALERFVAFADKHKTDNYESAMIRDAKQAISKAYGKEVQNG